MSKQRYTVFIETPAGCIPAKLTVPATADAVEVAMKLREKGLDPYRLRLEAEQSAWVVSVIDWKRAA
jgi:hypothetical protein